MATSAERYCNEDLFWRSQPASRLHAPVFDNIIASCPLQQSGGPIPHNMARALMLRSTYDFHIHLDARKLAAITIVAGGYGGDMPEDLAYDLLDDIDFYYKKVKCRKIEKLLPVLNKLVIEEQKLL